jgi:hypothetical protein
MAATAAASATTLKYAPVVSVDLSGNEINFADAETDGHRVQIAVAAADMNAACKWTRTVGSDRPVGSIVSADFKTTLEAALSTTYTDLDAIATGLSYSTGALVNAANVSGNVNDLIMDYVLFKVYGLTAKDTANKVYNATDALNMVTNADVGAAVKTSIDANNARAGPVDQMFRDLLAADPARFFTAAGLQIPGLFESNADAAGNGSWLLAADDILEIKLKFVFTAQVSRRVVSSQQQPLEAEGGAATPAEEVTEEVIIPNGHELKVRLQLKVTA